MLDLAAVEGFEWDEGNAPKNERKHGVLPAEAEQVFLSGHLLVVPDEGHGGRESRYHALGETDAGRKLHVTFTMRRNGTRIRVISARAMNRKERLRYEEAIEARS
jgi:uncharacterized DUF497 family protein